jgi:hypothetical protein
MNPQTHTSFIPKKPVIAYPASGNKQSSSRADFLAVVSIVVFLVSVVAYFGVWGMNFTQERVLENKKIEIRDVRERRGTFVYEENAEIVRRVEAFNSIFSDHLVITGLFNFLEQTTSNRISFTSFDYKFNNLSSVEITIVGAATDYASIAEQSNFYNTSNAVLIEPTFSNFIDNPDGTIGFTLKAGVRPEILLFNKINPRDLGIANLSSNLIHQQESTGPASQNSASGSNVTPLNENVSAVSVANNNTGGGVATPAETTTVTTEANNTTQ